MKVQQTNLYQNSQQNFGLKIVTLAPIQQKTIAKQKTINAMHRLTQHLPEHLKASLVFAMEQARGDAKLYARHTKEGKLFLSQKFYYRKKNSIDITNIRSARKAREAGESLFEMIRKHLTQLHIKEGSPNLFSEIIFR